jgi:hypothetical protein
MIVRIFTKTFTSTQRNSIVGHAADPLGRSLFYSEGVNECSRQIFKLPRMVGRNGSRRAHARPYAESLRRRGSTMLPSGLEVPEGGQEEHLERGKRLPFPVL